MRHYLTGRLTGPLTVWFTGLPCSGKSTLAAMLTRTCQAHGDAIELLDGDIVREYLSKGLGFSRQDRDTNILRIGWVCHLLAKHGVSSIVAAISPYRQARQEVRALVEKAGGRFLEVYVRCSLTECVTRDVKGLYAKALRGELQNFTGVSDPYEPPEQPDVLVDTESMSKPQCLETILRVL